MDLIWRERTSATIMLNPRCETNKFPSVFSIPFPSPSDFAMMWTTTHRWPSTFRTYIHKRSQTGLLGVQSAEKDVYKEAKDGEDFQFFPNFFPSLFEDGKKHFLSPHTWTLASPKQEWVYFCARPSDVNKTATMATFSVCGREGFLSFFFRVAFFSSFFPFFAVHLTCEVAFGDFWRGLRNMWKYKIEEDEVCKANGHEAEKKVDDEAENEEVSRRFSFFQLRLSSSSSSSSWMCRNRARFFLLHAVSKELNRFFRPSLAENESILLRLSSPPFLLRHAAMLGIDCTIYLRRSHKSVAWDDVFFSSFSFLLIEWVGVSSSGVYLTFSLITLSLSLSLQCTLIPLSIHNSLMLCVCWLFRFIFFLPSSRRRSHSRIENRSFFSSSRPHSTTLLWIINVSPHAVREENCRSDERRRVVSSMSTNRWERKRRKKVWAEQATRRQLSGREINFSLILYVHETFEGKNGAESVQRDNTERGKLAKWGRRMATILWLMKSLERGEISSRCRKWAERARGWDEISRWEINFNTSQGERQ